MTRVLHRGMGHRVGRIVVGGLGATSVLWLCVAFAATRIPPTQSVTPNATTEQLKAVVDAALADAAKRSGLKTSALKVLTAEPVTWGDGSAGCPEDGMNYTQALVRGFRVRVGTGEKDWLEYHAGADGKPFFCPPDRVLPPIPDNGI